jgi:Holliday junction DNA helicase RuvB
MDIGGQVIIGATTSAGSLSGPLRSRFVSFVLQPYTIDELNIMVQQAANSFYYKCPKFVSVEIAKRGKSTARIAVFLFKRIYDRISLNDFKVTEKQLADWFSEIRIDEDGLDNGDRAYLASLSDKPVGIKTLSALTGFDCITIEETIEPYLMTRGYVVRTARGRIKGDKVPLKIWN